MSGLVEFLRARLDEDYEAVRIVIGVNVMAAYEQGEPVPRWVPSPKSNAGIWDTNRQPRVKFAWSRERDHIIRHDPARVLAEVEAKLAIIKAHPVTRDVTPESPDGRHGFGCETCHQDEGLVIDRGWCATLRALAAVYAAHPDYCEGWRP